MAEKKPEYHDYITFILDDRPYSTLTTPKFRRRRSYAVPDPKTLRCVIPGIIRKIHVEKGTEVVKGDRLLILEAMKMENDIISHRDGIIKEIHVKAGDMATKGQVLVEFE